MHSHSIGKWFCGPEGLFGLHFGGIFHLIFLVAGSVLLFTFLRALLTNKHANPSALSILEERYASGEIDREEFLQRKKDLR